MTPAAPGRVLGSVTTDVLPSRQHHCNVDKWRSLDSLLVAKPTASKHRMIAYCTRVCICIQAGEELSDMNMLLKDIDDLANAVKLATRKIKRRLPSQETSTIPTPLVFAVDVSSPISSSIFIDLHTYICTPNFLSLLTYKIFQSNCR